MIVDQHKTLKGENASSSEIKQILEGDKNQKVLLLLDGYDEYKEGTSCHVDQTISRESLPNTCVLLTSRDIKELVELRQFIDVEAEITGFDPQRVEEYITKYLGSSKKCQKLITLANKNHLRRETDDRIDYGIMQVPIMLHMICVLFQRKVSLPKTRTGIISAIAERCPDWEEIRKSGNKTTDEWKQVLEATLERLGELAWERLEKGNKDLVFTKVSFGIKWRNMS